MEEWSDKADDFDATYLFRDDPVSYTHLRAHYTEAGDERTYRMEEMSADTMILVRHTAEPYGYEYYHVATYVSF